MIIYMYVHVLVHNYLYAHVVELAAHLQLLRSGHLVVVTSELCCIFEGGFGRAVNKLATQSQTDRTVLQENAETLFELERSDAHVCDAGRLACNKHNKHELNRCDQSNIDTRDDVTSHRLQCGRGSSEFV